MRIDIYYEVVTPESAAEGDAAERGEERSVELEDVGEAIQFLEREGSLEPSSSPGFHANLWYTGQPAKDRAFFEKGEERRLSYHLKGFTPDQEELVWKVVTWGYVPTADDLLGAERIRHVSFALVDLVGNATGVHGHPVAAYTRKVLADEVFVASGGGEQNGATMLGHASDLLDAMRAAGADVDWLIKQPPLPGAGNAAAEVAQMLDRADDLGLDIPSLAPLPKIPVDVQERVAFLVDAAIRTGAACDPETGLDLRRCVKGEAIYGMRDGQPVVGLAVGCRHEDGTVQPIAHFGWPAQKAAAGWLAQGVLVNAAALRLEVEQMLTLGDIPQVGSFSELHDHCDANMLGNHGNDEAWFKRWGVGYGVGDTSEALCGFVNCATFATDQWLKAGAPAVPAPR